MFNNVDPEKIKEKRISKAKRCALRKHRLAKVDGIYICNTCIQVETKEKFKQYRQMT